MSNEVKLLVQSQCELGEGILWHTAEQAIYWVDILRQQLWRYTPNTDVQACWFLPQMITAVLPTTQKQLLLALADELALFDPTTLSLQTVCQVGDKDSGLRLNDATLDSQGNVWFGSMDRAEQNPTGSFYRYANGELLHLRDGVTITNGPAFSCDGQWVYFTDTLERTIYRESATARSLADTKPFIQLAADEGHPDGMCCDAQGGLWVAHWGAACISRYDTTGALDQRISLPVANITKCAFGGSDLTTLYITTARKGLDKEALAAQPLAGAVFRLETKFQGSALQPFSL